MTATPQEVSEYGAGVCRIWRDLAGPDPDASAHPDAVARIRPAIIAAAAALEARIVTEEARRVREGLLRPMRLQAAWWRMIATDPAPSRLALAAAAKDARCTASQVI